MNYTLDKGIIILVDTYSNKKRGFTLTEAFITMVIIGIIVMLSVSGIKFFNPTEDERNTEAIKMAENIEAAALEILVHHASFDDFKKLKDGKGYFSIEDRNITKRMADLFAKYLSDIDYKIDLDDEYFSSEILDYDKMSTGVVLKNKFSNFFYVADGMIIGFRFYQSCTATEDLATPPQHKGKYIEGNICGSIFFDINGFDKPNKLGSDMFVLPLNEKGVKYNND